VSEQGQGTAEQDVFKLTKSFGQNGMLYGCGAAFRGSFYATPEDRAARVETRTRWVTVFYLPVVPLGTYRLIRETGKVSGRGRLFTSNILLSKEPLAWGQVVRVWAASLAIAASLVALASWWVA